MSWTRSKCKPCSREYIRKRRAVAKRNPPRLKLLQPRVRMQGSTLPVLVPDSWRNDKRGANARLYTYRWQKESKAFLRANPLCQCKECEGGQKRVRAATVVDHDKAHRGDLALFWDQRNWRAMAKDCHDRKTAEEQAALRRA